ncbi:LOW QUALITY PROTEIN: uncharacterized protein LOC117340067 [Pecten maximus]|uniref:LOW QUALITY PROTEIN: uncharacterized protein LOC117340067 n=1 Tax=Pecten maximus TaxID=6579 RepID=UPI001458E164|nr:LOW QUALITY PROTEIN: uncharacterized protein LOC117340067 [Pecten maximus]
MVSCIVAVSLLWALFVNVTAKLTLPPFQALKENYPGYFHHGGHYHNHRLIDIIGCYQELSRHDTVNYALHHDTSALRLSYAFNRVGGVHSLGPAYIHLSKYGTDSVLGNDGLQYIYHPIAYGPYLADKYGYPNVSKLHQLDPITTKKTFHGKQGILRVITYKKKHANLPLGHVALWDCDHFHQTKDFIADHTLITVEFWETPDSDCSRLSSRSDTNSWYRDANTPHQRAPNLNMLLKMPYPVAYNSIKNQDSDNEHLRHSRHKGILGN